MSEDSQPGVADVRCGVIVGYAVLYDTDLQAMPEQALVRLLDDDEADARDLMFTAVDLFERGRLIESVGKRCRCIRVHYSRGWIITDVEADEIRTGE